MKFEIFFFLLPLTLAVYIDDTAENSSEKSPKFSTILRRKFSQTSFQESRFSKFVKKAKSMFHVKNRMAKDAHRMPVAKVDTPGVDQILSTTYPSFVVPEDYKYEVGIYTRQLPSSVVLPQIKLRNSFVSLKDLEKECQGDVSEMRRILNAVK